MKKKIVTGPQPVITRSLSVHFRLSVLTGSITIIAETNLSQVVSDEGEILNNKPIIDILNPSDVFNIF